MYFQKEIWTGGTFVSLKCFSEIAKHLRMCQSFGSNIGKLDCVEVLLSPSPTLWRILVHYPAALSAPCWPICLAGVTVYLLLQERYRHHSPFGGLWWTLSFNNWGTKVNVQ